MAKLQQTPYWHSSEPGLHSRNILAATDAKPKSSAGFHMHIVAILTIHSHMIIQTINDALFSGLLSVSTLDHVAVSPLLKSLSGRCGVKISPGFGQKAQISGAILPHQTVCSARLSFRLPGEQWCSIRLTARRTTWLPPSNRGSMKQQQRSAERSCLDAPCGHARPLLPCTVGFPDTPEHIYGDLGWGSEPERLKLKKSATNGINYPWQGRVLSFYRNVVLPLTCSHHD